MLRNGFGEIAESLRRSTVLVEDGRRGSGSGVIWSPGMVVTNSHVIRGERATVTVWDGRQIRAGVLLRDIRNDIAVLDAPSAGPMASIGDATALRPGELVVAVGNPLGFLGALTKGVVHAVGPLPGLGNRTWVQAAVRLAPGNSGGPLADCEGRVIGINTMVVRGLGLAVPANQAAGVLARGRSSAWLGVTVQPVTVARNGTLQPGLLLLEVARNSPAASASLMTGDILVGVNSNRLESPDDLTEAIDTAGDLIELHFLRGDRRAVRHVIVRLTEWHSEAA
jgi:serine protease Do